MDVFLIRCMMVTPSEITTRNITNLMVIYVMSVKID